jgi:xylose isomerase
MKTSLGIWAFGPMVTRFFPIGFKPNVTGETTVQKVERAVGGLGDLSDSYEFHYPQELSRENLEEVKRALGGRDIYCLCSGLHLDPVFGRGGLSSPDDKVRALALERTLEAAHFAGELGAHFTIWPGIEGYNYPFQTPYAESWCRFIDGVAQAAEVCAGHRVKLPQVGMDAQVRVGLGAEADPLAAVRAVDHGARRR